MAFLKIVGGTLLGQFSCFFLNFIVGGTACVLSDDFRFKVDRNLVRPFRNYQRNLSDTEKFQTQEEFYDFIGNMGKGFINMFRSEENEQ